MFKLPTFATTNAHWLLRISVASVFLFHGMLKFSNLEGFAQMLPISYTQVVFVALANVGGGLLILLGGFSKDIWSDAITRIGALMNIPVMIGAIMLVHFGRWNFVPTETHPLGGMEFQAVMILIMLYIAITGNKGFGSAESDKVSLA